MQVRWTAQLLSMPASHSTQSWMVSVQVPLPASPLKSSSVPGPSTGSVWSKLPMMSSPLPPLWLCRVTLAPVGGAQKQTRCRHQESRIPVSPPIQSLTLSVQSPMLGQASSGARDSADMQEPS